MDPSMALVLLLPNFCLGSSEKRFCHLQDPSGLLVVLFYPDLSPRTLQRCADQIPDLIQARKEGKVAYFVLDKLIIKNSRFHERRKYGHGHASFPKDHDEESEVSFG